MNLPADSLTLIKSLQSPERYGKDVQRVELIETHISWVLLTGTYAYKIKKPVDFGFVNFTTLDRRKFFCEEELRLNRRLAPHLYLDVLPITGTVENPVIDGEGQPLEWAVMMRQFAQEQLLSRAIEQGRLQPRHVDQLAQVLADFHQRIAVAEENDPRGFGSTEQILDAAWGNFRAQFDQDVDRIGFATGTVRIPPELIATEDPLFELLHWTRKQAHRLHPRFVERRRSGAIRECHGDAHLGNALLENESVVLFDGIDFNEQLRWIDVISEVAFCAMDLEHRRHPEFAQRLINAYLEQTGDYAGVVVLPFYLIYRALVRAKVAHLQWKQQDADDSETRSALAAEQMAYLDLARQGAQPKRPFLIITHGLSGSGKSFGTQSLVEDWNALRARSDVERKRLANLSPLSSSGSGLEEGVYSHASTEATYQRLAECGAQILQGGYSAILDATFLKLEQRRRMRELAEQCRVPLVILDFQAPDAQLRQRLIERQQQGADPSEANLDVLDYQQTQRESLTPEEQPVVIEVRTELPNFREQLLSQLNQRREDCEGLHFWIEPPSPIIEDDED